MDVDLTLFNKKYNHLVVLLILMVNVSQLGMLKHFETLDSASNVKMNMFQIKIIKGSSNYNLQFY